MSNLKVGLQLYSIRDKMEKDMEAAFKAIKEIGYDYVEMAGYFNKSAEEILDLLNKYDLKCISVHQSLDFYLEKGQEGIDFVKKLGAEYSAIPWYGIGELEGDFDNTMKLFGDVGKELKENGLKLLYHNHDFEFKKIDGEYLLDIMYKTVSEEYLNPETDTAWIKYAGVDAVSYLEKYAGRIDIVHLKDFRCEKLANGPVYALIDNDGNEIKNDNSGKRDFEFCPLGKGINNIEDIVRTSEKIGAQYVIVEQDNWYEADSLECARESREYLKSIGL